MVKKSVQRQNHQFIPFLLFATCFIILLLIIIILNKQNFNSENGIQVGFKNSEAQPNDWIGLTSEKSVIKAGDDLIVNVYFGTLCSFPNDYLKMFEKEDKTPDDILVELSVACGECTLELMDNEYYLNYSTTTEKTLKVIEEFGSDKYPCLGLNSKYENFVIPSMYFYGKIGFIKFSIHEYGIYDDFVDRDNQRGVGVVVYYVVCDDNITLYDDYNSFYNNAIKWVG